MILITQVVEACLLAWPCLMNDLMVFYMMFISFGFFGPLTVMGFSLTRFFFWALLLFITINIQVIYGYVYNNSKNKTLLRSLRFVGINRNVWIWPLNKIYLIVTTKHRQVKSWWKQTIQIRLGRHTYLSYSWKMVEALRCSGTTLLTHFVSLLFTLILSPIPFFWFL